MKLVTNMPAYSGGGRYAREIASRLGLALIDNFEIKFPVLRRSLNSYLIPFLLSGDKFHATNQFLARLAEKSPTITTVLDMYAFKNLNALPFPSNFLIKKVLSSLNKAEFIITISKFTMAELSEFNINVESKVVYLGVSDIYKPIDKKIARKKLGLNQNDKIILNIGNENDERKNVKKVIGVMETMRGWKIIRLGKQTPGSNIIKMSNVSEGLMPYVYSACDAYLCLDKETGFGLPIIESMACGTPVVCNNTGAFPELDPTVMVEPSDTPEKIAEEIIAICWKEVPSKREFTWETCADEHKKIYEKFDML